MHEFVVDVEDSRFAIQEPRMFLILVSAHNEKQMGPWTGFEPASHDVNGVALYARQLAPTSFDRLSGFVHVP